MLWAILLIAAAILAGFIAGLLGRAGKSLFFARRQGRRGLDGKRSESAEAAAPIGSARTSSMSGALASSVPVSSGSSGFSGGGGGGGGW